MECHRCEHREDVQAGKYRLVPFEETPCAKCELKMGDSFAIEFDDERPGSGALDAALRPEAIVQDAPFPEEADADEERRAPVSALLDLVVTLLSLPPRTRDVVCWRFAGYKYRDIARVQHVTAAAVEERHRNAVKR